MSPQLAQLYKESACISESGVWSLMFASRSNKSSQHSKWYNLQLSHLDHLFNIQGALQHFLNTVRKRPWFVGNDAMNMQAKHYPDALFRAKLAYVSVIKQLTSLCQTFDTIYDVTAHYCHGDIAFFRFRIVLWHVSPLLSVKAISFLLCNLPA